MSEFRHYEHHGFRARVDSEFADEVISMLEPADDPLSAILDSAVTSGAVGRAPTRILALPGRRERIHLRRPLRGGLLGSAFPGRIRGETRALRELELTAELFEAGLPVVRPVLLAGQRGTLGWDGVVGTLHVESAQSAAEFLKAGPSPERLHGAARASGVAIRALHDAGVHHPDLHVGNLLVGDLEERSRVRVIDLDGARVSAALSPSARMRQLMRLFRSLMKRGLVDQVGTRGCSLFLSAYCDGDRGLRGALLARLGPEQRRVGVHALGYRRRETRAQSS